VSEIKWEDPPERPAGRRYSKTKWSAIAAQLRSRPGEWAVVNTQRTVGPAANVASGLRRGAYRDMTPGQFEVKCTAVGDEYRVYARFVGGES